MGVALAAIGRIGSVSPGAEKVEPPRPSCRGNWGPPASVVGPRTPGLGRRDSGVRTRASGLGRQDSGVSPRASVLGRRASVLGRWVSVGRSRSARLGRQPLVVCPRVSVLDSAGRARHGIAVGRVDDKRIEDFNRKVKQLAADLDVDDADMTFAIIASMMDRVDGATQRIGGG